MDLKQTARSTHLEIHWNQLIKNWLDENTMNQTKRKIYANAKKKKKIKTIEEYIKRFFFQKITMKDVQRIK